MCEPSVWASGRGELAHSARHSFTPAQPRCTPGMNSNDDPHEEARDEDTEETDTLAAMLAGDQMPIDDSKAEDALATMVVPQSPKHQLSTHGSTMNAMDNAQRRPRMRQKSPFNAPLHRSHTPSVVPSADMATNSAAIGTSSSTASRYPTAGFGVVSQMRACTPEPRPSPLGLGVLSQCSLADDYTPPQRRFSTPSAPAGRRPLWPQMRSSQRTYTTAKAAQMRLCAGLFARKQDPVAPRMWPAAASQACAFQPLLRLESHPARVSMDSLPSCSEATDDDVEMSDNSEHSSASATFHFSSRLQSSASSSAIENADMTDLTPEVPPPNAFAAPCGRGDYGQTPATGEDVDMADGDDADQTVVVEAGPKAGESQPRRRSRQQAPSVSPSMRVQMVAAEAAAAASITAPLRRRSLEAGAAVCETHRCRRCGCLPAATEASCRSLWTPRACHGCGTLYASAVRRLLQKPVRLDEGRRRELERC